MRDIGTTGENQFSSWCSLAGLTENKSRDKDRMGWDFIVEFPFNNTINALSIHKSPPKCMVQVKASDKREGKWSITLRNLLNLATNPLPCFYIFYEYDGQEIPQRAYIRHIDEALIENILRLKATTTQENLTIHYDESHMLPECTSTAMVETLLGYIGDDLSAYMDKKKAVSQNAGYEDNRYAINFALENQQAVQDFIDVSLGLKDSVDLINIQGLEKRFGQTYPVPELSGNQAKFAMPDVKPTTNAKLVFKSKSFRKPYIFDVEVYSPPFIDDATHQLFKVRYKTEFFELITDNQKDSVTIHYSFADKKFPLAKLRTYLKFLMDISNNVKFTFQIKSKEAYYKLGECRKFKSSMDFSNEINTIDNLIRLTHHFKVDEEVCISLDELGFFAGSAERYLDFAKGKAKQLRVEYTVDTPNYQPSQNTAVLGVVAYRIGEVQLFTMYKGQGCAENTLCDKDQGYIIKSPTATILEKFYLPKEDSISPEELYEQLDEHRSDIDTDDIVLLKTY